MFGLACDQNQFEKYICEHKNPYSVAQFLFETELINLLEKRYEIYHNYIFQSNLKKNEGRKITSQMAYITDKTKTTWLNYSNGKIIRFFSLFLSTMIRIRKYKKSDKDFFILSSINYLPVAMATQIMASIYKIKNIIIFTDCSESFAYDGEIKLHRRILKKIYKKLVKITEHNYDGYINFSPAMDELVNPYQKPSLVMEGFLNSHLLDFKNVKKYSKFVVLFAGSLLPSMGIQNLITAFKSIQNMKVELWIAGSGSGKKELLQLASGDERIHFLGFLGRKELFEMEKKASLLVNTRNPEDLFTKYSFPSKTFEYLASGTLFLSTRLECYSEEYSNYIVFIKDNKPETIKEKMEEIISWSEERRLEFGKKARTFVCKEKNSSSQGKKILEFLDSIL